MLEGKRKLPKGFKRSEPFKDGDAWNEWVATIANDLTKEGLRVSTTPNKSGQSNFVRLIEALQRILQKRISAQFSAEAVHRRRTRKGDPTGNPSKKAQDSLAPPVAGYCLLHHKFSALLGLLRF